MSIRGIACAAPFFLLNAALLAQVEPRWAVLAGPAVSFKVLGSEDARHGWYSGLQAFAPEPRLTFWGYRGEFVKEAYYMDTTGGGFRVWPVTRAHNYGLSLIGKYWLLDRRSYRFFAEAGWGLDYINRLTYDLYSRVNSSPVLGLGLVFPSSIGEIQVGIRWKHLSNAGTIGNNEGENYLNLLLGLRF